MRFFFSDKKVSLGACAPNLILFYQKKSHSLRFCIGQHPSSEILQPFSGKTIKLQAGSVRKKIGKLGEISYFGHQAYHKLHLQNIKNQIPKMTHYPSPIT